MPNAGATKNNPTSCAVTSSTNSGSQLPTSSKTTALDIGNVNDGNDTRGNLSIVMISYSWTCLDWWVPFFSK